MTDARAEHLLFCCEAAKAADNSEATIYRWELEELLAAREEAKELRATMHAMTNWLRQNANAETDPVKRTTFIEAHNAVLAIAEGRQALTPGAE